MSGQVPLIRITDERAAAQAIADLRAALRRAKRHGGAYIVAVREQADEPAAAMIEVHLPVEVCLGARR